MELMNEINRAEDQNDNPLAEEVTTTELSPLVMHVRCAQSSEDIPLDILHVNPSLSDEMIREAVARFLKIDFGALENCEVERHVNGNMSILSKQNS